MKPILIFDMDDTLIPTQELFNQTSLKVATYIKEILSLVIDHKTLINKMNEIDLENAKVMGFAPERFPISWMQTYEWYANIEHKPIENKECKYIYGLAYSLYETVLEPYQFTHETLTKLKNMGYPLILLTAGTTLIQEKRIQDAQLAPYFKECIIVRTKNLAVLRELLEQREINPANAYMIGNSLRSDIYPALEVNMKVIHLERDTWAYDNYEIDKDREEYSVIQAIEELVPLLEKENYISNIKEELKNAESNLERVKETYKEEPLLLDFYLPSAEKLVEEYKKILNTK